MRGAFIRWLTGRNRWQAALILFMAGALMALAFAPFHAWPVIFVSLPIFYVLLTASSCLKQALWRSFAFGYGYCMAGTWWIGNALLIDADKFAWLLPFSVLGLSAVMAVWFVVFGAIIYRLRACMRLSLFALLWVVVEYLRSIGIFGFPWNLTGYIALVSLPVAQLASIIGTYGLSFLVVMLGLVPVYWLGDAGKKQKIIATCGVIILFAACYGFGAHRLQTPAQTTNTMLRLVQPNIPQSVKGTRDGQGLSIETLGRLTVIPFGQQAPDITIWPETAYPFTVRGGERQALPKVKLLLTGALRAEGQKPSLQLWNSLVAMDGSGNILATYDKHQLVPFGEFVPLRSVLPLDKITPGDIDFSRGEGPRTIALAGVPPFSPLVCYEAIFPWLAVDNAERPQWMLNVTNDGWYGDSSGPYQHFDMVRMRAIEQGLPLVRVANSGISAMIDPYGRVVASMPLNLRATVDVRLPAALMAPLYAQFPAFILYLLVAAIVLLVTLHSLSKR